ncbi:class I SAM-dependent methyltransferase [Kingella negevensis]|uniref:class I SAM-dependent methyltransferase n=1 Tax=Kingella negevensis TaxID=1522312 RepID=UPI002550378B|nr:O-methyltransferase [Kingella negevensis]MDK4681243.1 O-methyltransferase [Kingella negevensis]MDK4683440.1 O-methyltransferase [Kingella negevensis]MDK4691425.1 O-methyltransferase [Kingella negevensis]MDK4693426.1 O-methyltransferase [Kingella negevensis]MDK4700039.1 O-methyltransferase [Kingella negevensis]
MTVHAPQFTPELLQYLHQISEPEHPILAQMRQETESHRLGKMAIAPEQATLLTWLARLMRVENYLEIGTFTGYSSTAMALALPETAKITCCDINVTFTDIAQQNWQRAGVSHKITLHLQPAIITMDEMLANGAANSFDMIFIDADKPPTPHYYGRSLKLIRSGGIIAIDNILLNGRIINPVSENSPASHAILRQFNAELAQDPRIVTLTVPLGDGLTLILKK